MNQSLPAEYFQLFRNDFLLLSRDSDDGIIVVAFATRYPLLTPASSDRGSTVGLLTTPVNINKFLT